MFFYLGQIDIFGFDFAPQYWSLCDGHLIPISQNTALFSLLGTTFGGNGQTSFGLPDLRGRVPVHAGKSYVLGEVSGVENVTLLLGQMPAHTHQFMAYNAAPDQKGDVNFTFAQGVKSAGGAANAYTSTINTAMAPGVISTAGGAAAHPNMQPYLALNYAIALMGMFPSRN